METHAGFLEGDSMAEATTNRIKRDLDHVLGNMRNDLDRVELLALALETFSQPIPDYEPRFVHLDHVTMGTQELGHTAGPSSR
jgi:hypothetical protein